MTCSDAFAKIQRKIQERYTKLHLVFSETLDISYGRPSTQVYDCMLALNNALLRCYNDRMDAGDRGKAFKFMRETEQRLALDYLLEVADEIDRMVEPYTVDDSDTP